MALIFDNEGNIVACDAHSQSLITIDVRHDSIHRGSHFIACHIFKKIGTNEKVQMILRTKDTNRHIHLLYNAQSYLSGQCRFFGQPTIDKIGTKKTIYNNHRQRRPCDYCDAYITPEISQNGNFLNAQILDGHKSGGSIKTMNVEEFILAYNTDYLLEFESLESGNICCMKLLFHQARRIR